MKIEKIFDGLFYTEYSIDRETFVYLRENINKQISLKDGIYIYKENNTKHYITVDNSNIIEFENIMGIIDESHTEFKNRYTNNF